MSATSDQALQAACEQLRGAAQQESPWEWDGRFEAGLLAFDKEREQDVLGVLDEVFDKIWSAKEVAGGPDEVKALESRLGGLRSGQMLLTAWGQQSGPTLWCAWWPWGSGARISIRVGVLVDAGEAAAAQTTLRTGLGIS
jgi:hypothetical protein